MPWYYNIVPESIKKNVLAYLVQRYLGQFFEEKLTRDQLNVDLYNGTGTINTISLDVEALNELAEKQNWPVEFVDGFIEEIYISVPWSSILKNPSIVKVQGLRITVQPKQRHEPATSMFESMWNSMTSSLQLAEECAKQDATSPTSTAQPYEGIEIFAQTIDTILSRVKVTFVDTVIQVEHVPKDSRTGVGIVINIGRIDYSDESCNDPPTEEATDLTNQDSKRGYLVKSFTTKKFIVEGVTLSTVEFSSTARTFSKSVLTQSQNGKEDNDSVVNLLEKSNLNGDAQTSSSAETNDGDKTPTERDVKLPERQSQLDGDRHVILFGKFSNKQEIRVRLKESENLTGPKVSIEVNVGSLVLYLSPRQFHVLMELANGLASPDIEDTSNVAPRTRYTSKPMSGLDYQRVEQELQHQLQPLSNFPVTGLQGAHGWSTAALDESGTEENFLPMRTTVGGMCDSTLSGISSSMESSVTSSMASSVTEQSHRTRRKLNMIDSDPTAEISHFQIRLASFAAVLLHEDVLVQPTNSEQILVLTSVQQMQRMAKKFFDQLGNFVLTAYGNKDFENAKQVFEKACDLNHIRLLAAPVQIEGDEKTTLSAFSITGQLIAAKLEILECLYSNIVGPVEYFPLLIFTDTATAQMTSPTAKPSLKLSFKHVEKTARNGASRRICGPKTDVTISLNKCAVEFDITIMDRISALLHPPNICVIDKPPYNPWNTDAIPSQLPISNPLDSRLDLKVTSPSINVKIRFPIPDFRPQLDMSKVPWWKRNVRPDYLSLVLSDALLQTKFQTSQVSQEYNVQSRGLDVFYYETENSEALPIAKAGFDDKYASSMQDVLLQSRLRIIISPLPEQDLYECTEPEQDPMTTSFYGAFENQCRKQPGPFSAKKVVHESDIPHSKPQKNGSEELILPGDKQEIHDFIESTTNSSKINVEVFLPIISVQLKSKHIYELIYNRINNDLLLWEPSAPKIKSNNIYEKPNYSNYGAFGGATFDGKETFTLCKSAIHVESESDSEEELSDSDTNVFQSAYDRMKFSTKQHQISDAEDKSKGQSLLSLNIRIGQGLLCMNPPVRDLTTNNVIPGQQGELLFSVEDATIFFVNGYMGDDDLGYMCMQVQGVQLHHCDMMSVPSSSPPLKEIGTMKGQHLHPTIHKSEVGMLANANSRGGTREMLTVAVKIQASHETHHVKTTQVAIGVNRSTLRYRMCNEPNSWISHILDFFNVQDYPIPGYRAKDVLTELHLHLWDCALDYRPLHLPLRCAITVGNFTMSSHLSAQANSSTLRFIFEECGLFLSEKAPPRNGVASSAPVDLKRDYVNVIELGLFEMSLKTNDKKSGINPHIDLRASNNILNIHTCADSGRALMQLITYFANDGDITTTTPPASARSPFSSPRHQADQELVSVEPQGVTSLTKSQHEHVTNLLGEAMRESDVSEDEAVIMTGTGAKVFFFPDEHQLPQDPIGMPMPQVTNELGDVACHANKSSDTDDEFCFVGDEPGLGLFPKSGVPEIKWLTSDPARVVENHFSIPVGKTDLLKSPKHFPTPTMRYTLCDMTVVWHMYGGNDFKLESESKKKTVNFSDTQYNVSFSNTNQGEVHISSSSDKKANVPWIVRGGVNRDLDVLMQLQLNKIRFQHEVYPETTTQASRQVLIVSEVIIRDRLRGSQMNVFLYEYTSQSRPKQTNAHMVVIKATHIRPDPKLPTQECCLKVSLLPLRLNVDQDSLLFLMTFFAELGGGNTNTEELLLSKHNTPTHQPPVMTINRESEQEIRQQTYKSVNENLIMLVGENNQHEPTDSKASLSSSVSDSSPVYFRSVTFSPEVLIQLDYTGKHVDMTHGSLPGIVMGLAQLNKCELRLKRITYRHGLLGVEKLISHFLQEWLNDIKKNQLPGVLGGIGPMHAFIQLVQGIIDLFWMPIEQYQKDGRIIRGLQRGANSFTTSTAMAALELSSRLVHLIQLTAETAYDMLSPGPSVRRITRSRGRKKRYHQPQDVREGLTNAYNVLKEGIGETRENIFQVVSREKEQKGYSGVVGGVLRQIPPTILKPVIIASEASSNILGGVQSQLVPDARREANQKWRSDEG